MKQNTTGYEYNESGFFIGANEVLYRTDITDKAKLLYLHITNRYNFFLYANQFKVNGKLHELDKVYCESQEVMAQAIGYSAGSKTKVNGLIKQLESVGLLKIVAKRDGKNSNYYIPLNVEGLANVTIPEVNESVMQGFSSKSVKREKPIKAPQKPVEAVKAPKPTPSIPKQQKPVVDAPRQPESDIPSWVSMSPPDNHYYDDMNSGVYDPLYDIEAPF